MQSRIIELFYLFFQGVLIFQTLIFFVLFVITNKQNLLYYAFFLFFAAVYFFVNAPYTFFGISEESVWNSTWYNHVNIPLIIAENFFYLLFLKSFFSDITADKYVTKILRGTLWTTPLLFILFIIFRLLHIKIQSIFYIVNLLSILPASAVVYVLVKKKPRFAVIVANGVLCTIIGTCITFCMIALGNNGLHFLFAENYPLFFIRIGVLGDMIFYLIAILKKWHFQESQFTIEMLNERLRISRELHDDIGSTLGSISIYSEVAKNRSGKNQNADEAISKIGVASRELIDKMSDIVWSINPNNGSFEQLQNRMQAFAAMMLTPRNITYDFNVDEEIGKIKLTAEERKNIFLIYKEAIHNIVKYADCKNVEMRLSARSNWFGMRVKDDGKGFDISKLQQTVSLGNNGINNMKARAESMHADFTINSGINQGTIIEFSINI